MPNSSEGFYFPMDFFGGTFRGIEENLDYIKSLGVGVIYLNPIVEARSNHRYDAADYLQPDPILGSLEDFERLCAAASERGIRIMLDGVFSHTGADSIYFNRDNHYRSDGAYNAGSRSPYYSWYDFRRWPAEYRCWWNFPDLPEVNEHDPLWQKMIITDEDSVVKTWLRRGAAGWRLDVADELPDDVLAMIRESAKAERDDAVILGEVWEDAITKFSYGSRAQVRAGRGAGHGHELPVPQRGAGLLLLPLRRLGAQGRAADAAAELPPAHVLRAYEPAQLPRRGARAHRPGHPPGRPQPLARAAGQVHSSATARTARGAAMQKLAALVQFTVPGVPSVYYGDETGMNGMLDPFNRAPFAEGGGGRWWSGIRRSAACTRA